MSAFDARTNDADTLLRHLAALSMDCRLTDGWEDGAETIDMAISAITALTAELTELRLQVMASDGQAGEHYDARIAAEAERNQLRETTKEIAAILQAAVVSGKVRGGDSYRIGGVYLQTVSDALDAANAALTPNTNTGSPS
jgi:hypothetical protein